MVKSYHSSCKEKSALINTLIENCDETSQEIAQLWKSFSAGNHTGEYDHSVISGEIKTALESLKFVAWDLCSVKYIKKHQ